MAHASRDLIVELENNAFAPDGAASTPVDLRKNAFVAVAAVTSKGFSMAGGSIDVTADDDDGFRQLLEHGTGKAISVSVEGFSESYAFRNLALSKGEDAVVIRYANPSAGYVSGTQPIQTATHRLGMRFRAQEGSATRYLFGTWVMTAYEETGGAPDGGVTFTATFENPGDWGYNANGR